MHQRILFTPPCKVKVVLLKLSIIKWIIQVIIQTIEYPNKNKSLLCNIIEDQTVIFSPLITVIRCTNTWVYDDNLPKICFTIKKLEDLKVLRCSPDLLNNVKIGQGQLQLITEQILYLPYTFWSSDLNNLMNNPSNSRVISEKKMFR